MIARVTAVLAFAGMLALPGGGALATGVTHPFQTGFLDDALFQGASASLGFQRADAAGATIERLRLDWSSVAPTKPATPTNPLDPAYDWSAFDAEVAAAVANNQEPIANILFSPQWARNAPGFPASFPDPAALASFAAAAAARYDGVNHPRVEYWEIWNEPNLGLEIEPQFQDGLPIAANWYRTVLNEISPAIKSVHADNEIIAGSTAAYFDQTPSTVAVNPQWGPLGFMRAVLCLTPQLTSTTPGCTVSFDAWSHHPYTEGGPTHKARLSDEVALGDLPKMNEVLDAAWKLGHISASSEPSIWVTEFSWNADPPSARGVPTGLLERWIPEAMYQMWRNRVTVLTWFLLVDSAPPYQTGFYATTSSLEANQPRPTLQAFTFPFVAYRSTGGVRFWGRTPSGREATVAIEQKARSGGWIRLGRVKSDRFGIVQGQFHTSSTRAVRARIAAFPATSVPFSLRTVPDRYFPSFGQYEFEPRQRLRSVFCQSATPEACRPSKS